MLQVYGTSIFKRSFKRRATCEEMERVVSDSINSLLMDIWLKKKIIHTSFGAMLKWKIIHFLDGKINLFDTDKCRSLDDMYNDFYNSGMNNGKDVIEYYSDTFQDGILNMNNYSEIMKEDIVNTISSLIRGLYDNLHKYLPSSDKMSIYIRVLSGIRNFICRRPNYALFKNRPRARYYYMKTLDSIAVYLREVSEKVKER
jgi:hypothetical protein